MILAIDSATLYAGLALYNQDGVHAEESWHAGRNHTVELTPRLTRMLQSAGLQVTELSALAVSIGPGSFTGLRIGLAVAKGLALPLKLPVIGVPTLEIVAYPFREQTLPIWSIVQAGRGRILAACYTLKKKEWQLLVEPHLTTFEALVEQMTQPALCTGEIEAGAAKLLQQNPNTKITVVSPAARFRRAGYLAEIAMARLESGAQDDPDALVPLYVSSAA